MPIPRMLMLLKNLAFILLLVAVIPFLILYFLGLPNGLISTLIYFQLIIIWIQAEISLRQQELYVSQALPIIVLHASSSPSDKVKAVIVEEKRVVREVLLQRI